MVPAGVPTCKGGVTQGNASCNLSCNGLNLALQSCEIRSVTLCNNATAPPQKTRKNQWNVLIG